MLQVSDGGHGWLNVVRVDCAHDSPVHVHRFRPDGSEVIDEGIVPEHCRNYLDAGFTWASNYVWDLERRMQEWR